MVCQRRGENIFLCGPGKHNNQKNRPPCNRSGRVQMATQKKPKKELTEKERDARRTKFDARQLKEQERAFKAKRINEDAVDVTVELLNVLALGVLQRAKEICDNEQRTTILGRDLDLATKLERMK